jgi:peptidoglycan/xylan/chitin deacetylase (PgdA/CDA1 family)
MFSNGLPILMYHRIVSADCPVPGNDLEETRYAVSLENFERQMDWLQGRGYQGVSLVRGLELLRRRRTGSEGTVVVTFDDGNLSDHRHALPLLRQRGFAATFFVGGSRVGDAGGLSESMLREMSLAGMDIGSHGMTHRFLSGLNEAEQRAELSESRELLTGITGQPVRCFAPPGGRFNDHSLRLVRELGYEAMCNSKFGYNRAGADLFDLKRLPVVHTTTLAGFEGLVTGALRTVLPAAARTGALGFARRVLSESGYRRLRAMFIKE